MSNEKMNAEFEKWVQGQLCPSPFDAWQAASAASAKEISHLALEVRQLHATYDGANEFIGEQAATIKRLNAELTAQPYDFLGRLPIDSADQVAQALHDWNISNGSSLRAAVAEMKDMEGERDAAREQLAQALAAKPELAKLRNFASSPDGWQLVPLESTSAMDTAGLDTLPDGCDYPDAERCYLAMLAAAPKSPDVTVINYGTMPGGVKP